MFYSPDLSSISKPEDLDWEKAIDKLATMIIQEQSAARLLQVRTQFYDLIIKCIQPTIILKTLTLYLINKPQVPEAIKPKIIEQAAFHVSPLSLA